MVRFSARRLRFLAVAFILATAGCGIEKSSNPLSPSVAGPIPGVVISAPKLLEPADGLAIDTTRQPITLLIENASTSGVRPLSYRLEIAMDQGFETKVFSREGVSPGPDGRTSLKLPASLAAERTYYWRARAEDGANTGPFSVPVSFHVFTPIVVGEPVLLLPAQGATIQGVQPAFTLRNAPRSGPAGPVRYTLQISASQAFEELVAQLDAAEQPNETKIIAPQTLPPGGTFYWRARAYETSDKMIVGAWSPTQVFHTAAPPPVSPGTDPPQPPPPGEVGPRRTISPDEALSIIRSVHDILGYDLGSSSSRESRIDFFFSAMAAVHYGHPVFNPKGPDPNWCVKDAGGGRPPSDDVMVRCDTRDAWDTVLGAGANGYRFHLDYIGILPSDQNVYPPPRTSLPR